MEKNKKVISSVIILLVLGAGAFFFGSESGKKILDKKPELILKADVNLSESDRLFVEKRLAEYEKQFSELPVDANIIDKVNLYFVILADYRILGEYGKAKELLESAMALDPKNSNLIATYSSLLATMGDKESALEYIDKAIELYSAESNYWLWKIDLEKELGASKEKLETIYKDALSATKNDLNIVTVYAQFLKSENRNEEAIIQWQKAIELYPENKTIYQQEIDALSK